MSHIVTKPSSLGSKFNINTNNFQKYIYQLSFNLYTYTYAYHIILRITSQSSQF